MSIEDYGRIFLPELLEAEVIALLAPPEPIEDDDPVGVDGGQNWLAVLLRKIERQLGLDTYTIKQPNSWNSVGPEDDWPIDRLPAIIVMTGQAAEPDRDEEGVYSDLLTLEVAGVASARTYRDARRNASRLAMAARAAIAQQFAGNSDWVAGLLAGPHAPRLIPLRDRERLDVVAAYQVGFHVVLTDTLSDIVSQTTPPEDPTVPAPDDPEVDEGAVTVTTTRIS